jgi:hypothetical protein
LKRKHGGRESGRALGPVRGVVLEAPRRTRSRPANGTPLRSVLATRRARLMVKGTPGDWGLETEFAELHPQTAARRRQVRRMARWRVAKRAIPPSPGSTGRVPPGWRLGVRAPHSISVHEAK